MPQTIQVGKTERRSYAKIPEVLDLPDLVEVQKRSYEEFLQRDVPADQRANTGLEAAFREMLQITDFSETASLNFASYELGRPKYDIVECQERGTTYAIPLKVKVRMVVRSKSEDGDAAGDVQDVKESDVYMGEIPLMTERGTFIINGAERVVVSQLKRSEGVIFKEEVQPAGRKTYVAQIIPLRGAWIEFESDIQNLLWVRLDRRKKRYATTFLRALHWSTNEQIVQQFVTPEVLPLDVTVVNLVPRPLRVPFAWAEKYIGTPLGAPISLEITAKAGDTLDEELVTKLRAGGMDDSDNLTVNMGLQQIPILEAPNYYGKRLGAPISLPITAKAGDTLDEELVTKLRAGGMDPSEPLVVDVGNDEIPLAWAENYIGTPLGAPISLEITAKAGDTLDEELVTKLRAGGMDDSDNLTVNMGLQQIPILEAPNYYGKRLGAPISLPITAKAGDTLDEELVTKLRAGGMGGTDMLTVVTSDVPHNLGKLLAQTAVDQETGEVLADVGTPLTADVAALLREAQIETIIVRNATATDDAPLTRRILAASAVDADTGEVLAETGVEVDTALIERLIAANIAAIVVIPSAQEAWIRPLLDTLRKDPFRTQDEALMEIFRALQPGDSPTPDSARTRIERLYFDPNRYDLSRVGRYKLNKKLGLKVDPDSRVLEDTDIIAVLRYLLDVMAGKGIVDDIDHLGNRRVRAVGELLQSQVRVGLLRMARNIRERMTIQAQDLDQRTPNDLINPKPLTSAIKDFFGSSQLSQFMAQTNPLDELTHKRRLSALGPGGLHRDRATYDVRDVHHTHYGRVCPIETPEGPSVGLMVSLSCYAQVNEYGFLETPYQRVQEGQVVPGAIDYLSADQEDLHVIAQANIARDAEGTLSDLPTITRHRGDFPVKSPTEVDYVDVSPKQVVSVSAALIPFLEHDDANRALMGANQQRQAVPLLRREAPVIGTGIEYKAALDSGAVVVAKRDGIVESVTADEIIVRTQEGELYDEGEHSFSEMGYDVYRLIKYKRSNSNTVIDQMPICRKGQRVRAGEVIADGSATNQGELALGANVLVAFMPWEGYNYEDAILISERLVQDDVLTSIHIEEFELDARDTKLGKEEITRDIPNKSEEALSDLDEEGIVRIGSVVEPWDILVGKVTPKGESELGPEEKLLRAIFGDKAGDFKDASLEARPGVEGVVINTRIFARKEREKDRQSELREQAQIKQAEKDCRDKIALIQQGLREQAKRLILGKELVTALRTESGTVSKKGDVVTQAMLDQALAAEDASVSDLDTMERIRQIRSLAQGRIREVNVERDEKIEKINKGDELKPGVLKLVRVYVATKRKISVGDKLSGRHGNKGVISKILPIEDMPYLEDGTPVDMILNPLGVPGRMNVGQILETHLGWAASQLGMKVATPVFDGASEDEIRDELEAAGLPLTGKARLYDGRTGEAFHQKVTVGLHYMLKLNHLVADKIHARSIGPYSLVTQQPLGGKAQLGGQRFGEMEVWALEAYGAAYLLQELLTIKSDDIVGRTRVYEAIVKGENAPEPGTPESFNVLIKELQSLCLDVTLEESSDAESERALLDQLTAEPIEAAGS